MRKIKLIWDFRGPDSLKIAEHHVKHLKEYIAVETINCDLTGFEALSNLHSIAFIIVEEPDALALRDVLKPHRGLIYKA